MRRTIFTVGSVFFMGVTSCLGGHFFDKEELVSVKNPVYGKASEIKEHYNLIIQNKIDIAWADAVKNPVYGWGVSGRTRFKQDVLILILTKTPGENFLMNAPIHHKIFQNKKSKHGLNLKNIATRGALLEQEGAAEKNGEDLPRYVAPAQGLIKLIEDIKQTIEEQTQEKKLLCCTGIEDTLSKDPQDCSENDTQNLKPTALVHQRTYKKDSMESLGALIEELKQLGEKKSSYQDVLEKGLKKIHDLTGVPIEKLRHLPAAKPRA